MTSRAGPAPTDDDLQALYEEAPFGYVSTTADWTIRQVNRTLLELLDRSSDEVIGHPLPAFFSAADRIFHETHYAPLVQLQGRVKEVEVHLVRADGERVPVLLSSVVVPDATGDIAFVRTGVAEVRDRHRYEEQLRLARRRAEDVEHRESLLRRTLAQLVAAESTVEVAEALDRLVTHLLDATDGQLLLLGSDGRHLTGATGPGDEAPVSIELTGDDPVAAATRTGVVCRLDGPDRVVVPIRAGERVVGVFTARLSPDRTLEDDHVELMSSLAQPAARVVERIHLHAHKDRVLGMVAHDLRTPLTTISGFAQTLQQRLTGQLDPTDQTMLDRIVTASERSARLTEDLLVASAPGGGRLLLRTVPVVVGEFVHETVAGHRSSATAKDIDLQVRDHSGGATAEIDPDRIQQVLDNLVANAIKYAPHHTGVLVEVSVTSDRTVVAVVDDGPGIAPDDLPHLFQAFAPATNLPTAGERSTGLGLAIAQQLVAAHGGDITVDAVPSGGSRFTFWVPRQTD